MCCCHDHHRGFGHHEGFRHREPWGPRGGERPHEHRDPHHHHCGPDCWREGHTPFGFRRHFVSNREVIEALKAYLKELENEAQGVREAIAEIEAEMQQEAQGQS